MIDGQQRFCPKHGLFHQHRAELQWWQWNYHPYFPKINYNVHLCVITELIVATNFCILCWSLGLVNKLLSYISKEWTIMFNYMWLIIATNFCVSLSGIPRLVELCNKRWERNDSEPVLVACLVSIILKSTAKGPMLLFASSSQ